MRRWVVLVVLVACGDTPKKVPDAGPIDTQLADAFVGPDAPVITDTPDGTDKSGTRLKRRLYVTADGFKDQFGWFDSLLGTTCTFFTLSDASSRCIPSAAPELPVQFTNDMCTDRVLYSSTAVTAAYVTTRESCSRRMWKNLQPSAATTIYIRNFMGTCVATSNSGLHYTATEALPSEFVSATIALEGTSTELKARVRTTADGGREFLHMYSSSLASPCLPDLLSDGVVRCAPRLFADSGDMSPPAFSNATCTQSVRAFAPCAAIPQYKLLYTEPPSSCITVHDYAPMTPYTPGPLYNLISSQCQAATPTAGLGYGAIGATLAPTAFVAEASRALGPTATRVRGYYGLYADGSVGARDLWDTVHGVECEFKDAGAVSRCMPVDYLDLSGAYADAACTEPLADSNGDTCGPGRRPDWARGAPDRYYRVTGDFSGTTIYIPGSTGCTAITPIPTSEGPFYTVGAAITDWDIGTRMTEP